MRGHFEPHSEEAKRKISEHNWMKGRFGEKNPCFGKHHKLSDETKKRMSESGKKKIFSEEHRENISKAKKGKSNPLKGNKSPHWKGGVTKNKKYIAWQKNKRNRVIKRLKIESLSHTFGEWELLKKQYGFACPCCHKKEPKIKLTIDHIIPLSKGGSDLIENIQPLCLKCNMRKHSKIIKY